MEQILTCGEAIREALYDELSHDDSLVLMGEDIRYNLYAYTEGLWKTFGDDRVIDVPLSEAAVVGTAIGAAMRGCRVVVDLTISNFLYVAMDQIVSMAAKMTYQNNGHFSVPITIMVSSAYGASAGAQHSDRPHPMFMNVPGLKVVAPVGAQKIYSTLRAAIQDNNPVLCFLDKSEFYQSSVVDKKINYQIGKANIVRHGEHITLIGIQGCVNKMRQIADKLEKDGINSELIDVNSLVPLDTETIYQSVRKTGRVVIADTANRTCCAAEHIASLIVENCFEYLKKPIKIVANEDVPLPFAKELEDELVVSEEKIMKAIKTIL